MSKIFNDTGDITMPYDDIGDIDDVELEKIRERICYQEASTVDKLRLKKHYFKRNFEPSKITHTELSNAWNNRYDTFFEHLGKLVNDDTNVINKIITHNNLNFLTTDCNLRSLKLDNMMIHEIFQYYNFKDLKATSTPIINFVCCQHLLQQEDYIDQEGRQ